MSYKIIQGDCLEVMRTMSDVDCIITSPPYNMGGVSLGYQPNSTVGQTLYGDDTDNHDDDEYTEKMLECLSLMIQRSVYVFYNIQWVKGTRNLFRNINALYSHKLKDIFIWEKQAVSQIAKGCMARGFEFVFCFGQDNSTVFRKNNFPSNGYVPNIQTWFKSESFPEHHATFPKELPLYFIKNFTKEYETVCDPFMGMGTTGVAALKLGRQFIGIEIDPKYCAMAEKRIKNECGLLIGANP